MLLLHDKVFKSPHYWAILPLPSILRLQAVQDAQFNATTNSQAYEGCVDPMLQLQERMIQ